MPAPNDGADSDAEYEDPRSHALAHIRRESLDVFNRLHSVAEDVQFVRTVAAAYPDLPILPNLRCGAWYVDPQIASPHAAYFKSTDGHFNNWSFNLRRPNLHLLPVVAEHHGFILVDSTRAGKRMPDALSKTVPIWCAVLNRAIAIRAASTPAAPPEWDSALYTPPGSVSAQEHTQIAARIDGWARALLDSAYVLPDLPHPLRPLWITPATSAFPRLPPKPERTFIPVICVSASRQTDAGTGRRVGGFAYVQGSGDDHELWGMGLTPALFWRHSDALLAADRASLADRVRALVAESLETEAIAHSGWTTLPTPVRAVGGRLLIGRLDDLPSVLPLALPSSSATATTVGPDLAYVLVSARPQRHFACQPPPHVDTALMPSDAHVTLLVEHHPPPTEAEHASPPSTHPPKPTHSADRALFLALPAGKKGQHTLLAAVLPSALPFIAAQLARGRAVCVCCDTGRDAAVGVALAALQACFDAGGRCVADAGGRCVPDGADADAEGGGEGEGEGGAASKTTIATRLQWIIASRPEANPSRATLKRVNEFLLTPASLRRHYGASESPGAA